MSYYKPNLGWLSLNTETNKQTCSVTNWRSGAQRLHICRKRGRRPLDISGKYLEKYWGPSRWEYTRELYTLIHQWNKYIALFYYRIRNGSSMSILPKHRAWFFNFQNTCWRPSGGTMLTWTSWSTMTRKTGKRRVDFSFSHNCPPSATPVTYFSSSFSRTYCVSAPRLPWEEVLTMWGFGR